MQIPITERARRFGYLLWSKKMEDEVRALLKERDEVQLIFNGADHGTKNVDWRFRRISIGYRWTRMIPEQKQTYKVTFRDGALHVECE
jgi:hypothetical protein